MAALTNEETLQKIKTALCVTGNYLDNTLQIFIDDVKGFMLNAGVKQRVIDDSVAVGAICRGVSDLWNNGSGNTDFSQYFKQRVIQLTLIDEQEVEENGNN